MTRSTHTTAFPESNIIAVVPQTNIIACPPVGNVGESRRHCRTYGQVLKARTIINLILIALAIWAGIYFGLAIVHGVDNAIDSICGQIVVAR